jgi:hypothetical protein
MRRQRGAILKVRKVIVCRQFYRLGSHTEADGLLQYRDENM